MVADPAEFVAWRHVAVDAAGFQVGMGARAVALLGVLVATLAREDVGVRAFVRPPVGARDVLDACEDIVGHVLAGLVAPDAGVSRAVVAGGGTVRNSDLGAPLDECLVVAARGDA